MVVREPKARCLPIDVVAGRLGASEQLVDAFRRANGIEATVALSAQLPASVGCRLITFAKLAMLKNRTLSFDLGPNTRNMQLRALQHRYNLQDSIDVLHDLPRAAYNLLFCSQCGKIANACCEPSTKGNALFNEIGIAQVMTRVCGKDGQPEVRCAKRSSAALRTAIHKESVARKARIEALAVTRESTARGLRDGVDSSHIQRIRRDAQTCVTQLSSAVACGDTECLQLDLLGRAIRVNGKWHAICTVCGAITRVGPAQRFGIEICCLRCDPEMLGLGPMPPQPEAKPNPFDVQEADAQACRFCNKAPNMSSSGNSTFKLVRARTDRSRRNKGLPPPLRIVNYCSSHWKPWIVTAHRVNLDSKVIIAHLNERATPVLGAEQGSKQLALLTMHRDVARPVIQKKRRLKLEKRIKQATSRKQ